MVHKAKSRKVRVSPDEEVSGRPTFPYCTAPKSLRRFLEMVPQKPRPPKVTTSTLKVWGLKSGNDASILRVLKKIEFLGSSGETTQAYADFMRKDTGASALGRKIQFIYSTLFENVPKPETASTGDLLNFFNIHSGGGPATIKFQIDTFKALATFATFGESDPLQQADSQTNAAQSSIEKKMGEPAIRIDLHIHLPENKNKSDYDAILESIATHLYGHNR